MTLRDKMLAVIADVNASVAEREELVEMIAIALLTRKNLFVLGEPGQAKSYAINLFRRHITGARQFERLLSKQSDEEQLFGRVAGLCAADRAGAGRNLSKPALQPACPRRGHRLHEGRARNMGKAQERHRKAGALSCSALGASQKRAHGADSRQNSRGQYRIAG